MLEAALVKLLTAHFQCGLEPHEWAKVRAIQRALGREVVRFVPTLLPAGYGDMGVDDPLAVDVPVTRKAVAL